VIKARHSVFYSTPLYEHLANAAFEMMERNMHAQVRPAAEVRLG
jgi:hypothetical protein